MTKRKWSKEKIVDEIREIVEKHGEEHLTTLNLAKSYPLLYQAMGRYFEKLEDAIVSAGFDCNNFRQNKRWGKDEVLAGLKKIVKKSGKDGLNAKFLRENCPALYHASRQHFGSLEHAVTAIGFNYKDIKKHRDWNKNKVVSELQAIAKKDGLGCLYHCYLRRHNSRLIGAVIMYFGNLSDAITFAGFDYDEVRKKQEWNDCKIIEALQIIARRDGEECLNDSMMRKNNGKLLGATRVHFGSLENAVRVAGFDYDKIRGTEKWNGDKVIYRLQKIAQKNGEKYLTRGFVKRKYRGLADAGIRYFGNYGNAVEAAGFNYSDIKRHEEWSKDRIIYELQEVAKEKGQKYLSDHMLRKYNGRLLGASRLYFGTLENAVEAAGFDYSKIRKINIYESMVRDVLINLFPNIEIKTHYTGFKWLRHKGQMHVDFYIPTSKAVVEFHGQQHYEFVDWGGSEPYEKKYEKFKAGLFRDKLKRKLFKKHGIKLIVFKYDEDISTEAIKKKLIKKGIL